MGSYWTDFWPISALDLVIGPRNLTCHAIMCFNSTEKIMSYSPFVWYFTNPSKYNKTNIKSDEYKETNLEKSLARLKSLTSGFIISQIKCTRVK